MIVVKDIPTEFALHAIDDTSATTSELTSYHEAVNGLNKEKWLAAMWD